MTPVPLIDLIAGARPNFMKIAPIVEALRAARARGVRVRFRLVHTGQHYDPRMSGSFFEQLGLPEPDVNLEVGSGTAAEQTGAIMVRYEKVLQAERSALCVVVGDVTSTLACSLTARKAGIPVAHVEAGLRSGDWSMPEEINRVATDALSNYFFTTSEGANENLRRSGIADDRLFFVGNTMIDTLLRHRSRFRAPAGWAEAGLGERGYLVLTLHRPSNVDDPGRLRRLLEEILRGAEGRPVVFPVHPRTAKSLQAAGVIAPNLRLSEPLGYLEFNYVVERALAVVTDSGGVTEETTVLGVPCLTLRDTTERPETVALGTNELIGSDPAVLPRHLAQVYAGQWKRGRIPPRWDGRAGERIVAHLIRLLGSAAAPVN